MKIIIINGSPRKNGATSSILHTITENLLSYGDVSAEYIDIGELNIAPCNSCCLCYKSGKCFINDDAEKLSDKIASADGLIIGSPTYASNISGILKQFIDRGHFVIEQLLYKKYAISVATGENYGSNDTCIILNKLLKYSGAYLSGKIICNIPFNTNPSNDKIDRKCKRISKKFYSGIKNKKKYYVHLIIHKIIFTVGIRPFVKSKGELYKGVIEKWRKNNIPV